MGAINMNFQVVVLAGSVSQAKRLFPLVNEELPKALLPVANRPLISYVLELLEANGLNDLIVVVGGEEAASQVGSWITDAFYDRLLVEVVCVSEDVETADVLRKISHRLNADDLLIVSGDLVCDVPLGAVAAAHRRQEAELTALLCSHPGESPSEGVAGMGTKDKQPSASGDVIGLDIEHQYLMFLGSGGQGDRELKVSRPLLRAVGQMEIRTDLVDAHCYAVKRALVQEVLEARPEIKSIKYDLVPYLIRSQLRRGSRVSPSIIVEEGADLGSLNRSGVSHQNVDDTASWLQRVCSVTPSPLKCCAYIASKGTYCARVNSLQVYEEANRALTGEHIHLTGYKLSARNNVIGDTAVIGNRSTVGPYCVFGEGSQIGDKSSVKRSAVGRHCRIGSNVKIINSVVMNYVTVGDHCQILGSIVSSNAHLQERVIVKDCQLGAGYNITAGTQYRSESLAKKEKS